MPLSPLEELRTVIALSDLPDDHLQWIIEHSDLVELADGDILTRSGEPTEVMWILFEGQVSFYMDMNGRQVFFYLFENSKETGGIGGLLPYSRMKVSLGFAYAVGKVRARMMHK